MYMTVSTVQSAAFNTGDVLADMSGEFGDNHEVEDDLLSQYGLVEGEVGGRDGK